MGQFMGATENYFWKASYTEEQWSDFFQSKNQITLITTYLKLDKRFNAALSSYLYKHHEIIFTQIAFLYINHDYERHRRWIENATLDIQFRSKIERLWELQESKKILLDKWADELIDIEFDQVLQYFSSFFGANANSRQLWKDKLQQELFFKIFIREAYDHYINRKNKSKEVFFKWKPEETPLWDILEHGSNSMRFKSSSYDNPEIENFRKAITEIYITFSEIELELIQLKYPGALSQGEKEGTIENKVKWNLPRLGLAWNSILITHINKKELTTHDIHWLINSVRNDASLLRLGVITNLQLMCLPQIVWPFKKVKLNLVDWSIALSEFIEFQSPKFNIEVGLFSKVLNDRKSKFQSNKIFDSIRSLQIVPREKLISFFREQYDFSIDEIEMVLDSLTFKLGSDKSYRFFFQPLIETENGNVIIAMRLLSNINWSQQLAISLSDKENNSVSQEISRFREKLVEYFLGKLHFQTYRDVKILVKGRERGNIDALIISENSVYLFEVKGFDRIDSYDDLHIKGLEKIHAEAVDQLKLTISRIKEEDIVFSDSEKKSIVFPPGSNVKAMILSNLFSGDGKTKSGISKASITELGLLCAPELQEAFIQTLEIFYPDKTIIPKYRDIFDKISMTPSYALSILELGEFWDNLDLDMA